MKMKTVLFLMLVILLSSCADRVSHMDAVALEPVGFLHGLWHGITAPFSMIGSWFSDDIAMWASYNNGCWYEFGFILGVGGLAQKVVIKL